MELDEHELVQEIAEVIQKADDDRLPDDTIWYGDAQTLPEAIARRVVNIREKGGNE
ncbi:hypothetical protein HTZ84_21055 [Haloterrigena sp. SYSU A558-1]|uniref:Uncharacterized protein n=1 Tax=Haloterrigena gelatinilytica TaxID=2741724 RepID=A0ABX2LES5_9EURY|nr:hypothetical protein [Haloterrigena gelatinilytica]NUC74754.1 hypothetical protein [Haloterrigena gelatinilytica]